MKSKTLALALILAAIAMAAPATYAITYSNANGSSRTGSHCNVMDEMMGDTEELEDEDWWNEMKEFMEEHMEELEDEDWWEEMKEFMEERMEDDEEEDDHCHHHGCH